MKKRYLSIILFLLIFCILGIPFTKWGFRSDDWGNIFHSVITTWQDVITFFTDGQSLDAFYWPSNAEATKTAFFCGLYRPMSLVYLIPQYIFFAAHPYGYFLITIAIHALSAILIFNLYSLFTSIPIAFFAALFFGFHPSLWTWLGWISAQTYQIELFILLCIILLLKSYLDHKKKWAYLFACALFCTNIFLHEQTFFLPLWLLFAIPLYEKEILKSSLSLLNCLQRAILVSLPFFAITFFYFIARLHFFPLTSNTATLTFEPTWLSFKTRMLSRAFDFITFISDVFGLTALPKNTPWFKGFLIFSICLLLLWFFTKTNKKMVALFLAFSIPLFGWPALLMHNQPRYYYIAIPLFIMLVIVLLPIQKLKTITKKLLLVAIITATIVNGIFLFHDLKRREQLYHPVTQAFTSLAKDSRTTNRAICFINLPQEPHLFGACAQAIWLLRGDSSHPVFNIAQEPLEAKYQKFNPLFIAWDNKKQQFHILSNTK